MAVNIYTVCQKNHTQVALVYLQPFRRRIDLASSVMSTLNHIWKNRRLSLTVLTTKPRIYQALMLFVLLYTAETRTFLDADSRGFEACTMKCHRQLLQIKMAPVHSKRRHK